LKPIHNRIANAFRFCFTLLGKKLTVIGIIEKTQELVRPQILIKSNKKD
jgi:hypothetical protein